MNNFYPNSYPGYTGYPTGPASQYTLPQPSTNKIYVTSLDDAMQRYANPNSVMIYVLQDESAMFEIFTDAQGKKIPKTRKFIEETPASNSSDEFVPRTEFDALKAKIEAFMSNKEA